jgi:hypothetical protein
MNPLRLLAAATVLTAAAGTATTATAMPARMADCLADTVVTVPAYPAVTNGDFYTDPLAVSPSESRYTISAYLNQCLGTETRVTVSRPDGSQSHRVLLDYVCDRADCRGTIDGVDQLSYATATGPWRITKIDADGRTVNLANPVYFTIKRATVATLSVPAVNVPAKPRATGRVTYWTAAGTQAPVPGRRVSIRTMGSAPQTVATTTTDSNGRYSVTVPVAHGTWLEAAVPSTSTLGWDLSNSYYVKILHPTSITGTAAPTSATVIRNGTKMSTYGHLRVLSNAGKSIPFASQKVVVQTRPKANPSVGYSTVATATTTNTGYYYTNWNATVDADVRVAFNSPYQTITGSSRWVRSIDVQ